MVGRAQPDTVIGAIKASLQNGTSITIASLGGVASICAASDVVVAAPFLDVIARLADCADEADRDALDDLLLRSFSLTQFPLPFREAANVVIASKSLRARIATRLQKICTRRVEERTRGMGALVAAYSLETLFRLSLSGLTGKLSTLAVMAELGESEDGLFAEHAVKLTGAAYHVWGEEELLPTLERLRSNPDAQGEAAFECGLVHLSKALATTELDDILTKLETARVLFVEARRADEDRADAVAYCAVIDLVKGFARGVPSTDLAEPLRQLAVAVADRTHLLGGRKAPVWLRPRYDREIAWVHLLAKTQRLTASLTRPSWLNAMSTMQELLAVYDADRTITTGPGLGILLRPRIEEGLARTAGLLNHLDELLETKSWMKEYGEAATRLHLRVAEIARLATLPGKAWEDVLHPLLASVLQASPLASDIPLDLANRLELALGEGMRSRGAIGNPIVQQILSRLQEDFRQCFHYAGSVKDDFDELLLQIILFCKDRQDSGTKALGKRGAYLRDPDAKEFDLQADLREWLAGNLLRGDLESEVEGVATGRADIYLSFGSHRFIIELKRHKNTVDSQSARQYVGQAGSYQATNVKLGMLGILDVNDRAGAPPSLEECIWYDCTNPPGSEVARHLAIFRVPGALRSPSSLSKANKQLTPGKRGSKSNPSSAPKLRKVVPARCGQ